jgi:hypothetical protein
MNGMLTQIFKEIKISNQNVGKFIKEFKKNGPFYLDCGYKVAYNNIDYYQKELSKLIENAKLLNELEDLFELPLSSHFSVNDIQVYIYIYV